MRSDHPGFRSGAVLATAFTGTLTERQGERLERIPTPARLVDWMRLNGFGVDTCTPGQLDEARELREAIHAAATAAALGHPLPRRAVRVINANSARGQASAALTTSGRSRWRLRPSSPVQDALGVIATDAIGVVAGERDGRLALCASPTCRAVFLDVSQSRSRRWCDMNTCGNRAKKARFRGAHRTQT